MKDNGNFPFLANQTGKFSCLMISRQTLLLYLCMLRTFLQKVFRNFKESYGKVAPC